MVKRTLLLICLLLTFASPAAAQLGSVPNTFTAGSVISSANVNTNFSTAYALALNRTGGTMTGSLTTLGVLPTADNVSNIGSAALSYSSAWFDGTVTIATLVSGTLALTTDLPITEGGTGSSTASAARTALGLIIGTDVQAFNTNLTAINQSLVSGAAPTFVGTNFSAIPTAALSASANIPLLSAANTFTNLQTITRTAGEQLDLRYDVSNRMHVSVTSAGVTQFEAFSSGTPFFQFNDLVVLPTNSGVFGLEAGTASFVINADESDDVGDRWTFAASDGATAGALTLTHAGTTFGGNFTVTNVDDVTFTAGEATDLRINLQADDGDDANDTWKITVDAANQFLLTNPGGGDVRIAATGAVTIPYLASSTGTRYVCSTTTGELTDSASACSGTDPSELALEVAELRNQLASLTSSRWAAPMQTVAKAPVYVASTATSVPAGRGLGAWVQVAAPGGACDQLNPAVNDFVAYYGCLDSVGRGSATGSGGLFGTNMVLTANGGHNATLIGHEVDIQNVSGEGVNVPAAWAANSKVGFGAVLASNGSTSGDGSAGFSVTTNGDAGDQWRYGYEASGIRTASFYARKVGNAGTVNPNAVLLGDVDSTFFLRTKGTHTLVLDSATVDIYGTQDGRIDIAGLNPVMNMAEMDQPLNGKFWRYQVAGGDFTVETVNDAYTSAARILALRRNGEVNVPNLAGAGDRAVCASADGTLIVCGGNR